MTWTISLVKKKSRHFKSHSDRNVDWAAGERIEDSIHIPALENSMRGDEGEEPGLGEKDDIVSLFLI